MGLARTLMSRHMTGALAACRCTDEPEPSEVLQLTKLVESACSKAFRKCSTQAIVANLLSCI